MLGDTQGGLEHQHVDDYVAFVAAGQRGIGQYRCAACGYGITIRADLPPCPMCGGDSWEETPWSPVSNASSAPLPHPLPNL